MLRFAGIGIVCGLCWVAQAAVAQEGAQQEAPPGFEPAGPGETPPAPEPYAPPPEPAPEPYAPPPEPAPEPYAPPQPAPAPAPYAPQPAAQPAPYAGERYEGQVDPGEAEPAYDDGAERDSEPEAGGGSDFTMPGFSIRLDPFNWLIEGRLGLELEVVAWEFISVELVPVFVANSEPPSFNFSGRDDPISQHSNGIGAIAGTSLGAGFWLSGTPFRGYVIRAILTNYGFTYESRRGGALIDRVEFTERRLMAFFGSHSRFGFFTISGGIGLGYELNQAQRCFANAGSSRNVAATSGCPDPDEQHIRLESDASTVADLNGPFHPIYLEARFSVGVAFD